MPVPPAIFTPGVGPVGPAPFDIATPPGFGPIYRVTGVTKDLNGAALGGCTVLLFRTRDNVLIDQMVSDGSGNYSFQTASPAETYYCVAYKTASPDVTGATVNTLVGV